MEYNLEREELLFLNFRKQELSRQLAELENIINGREKEFYSFVRKKFGKVTEQTLEAFADDMLDCLEHYTMVMKQGSAGLSEEDREYYACFLYCTIQGLLKIDDFSMLFPYVAAESAETFANIVDVARSLAETDSKKEAFFLDEAKAGWNIKAFRDCLFGYMDEDCSCISGKDITETFPEEKVMELKCFLRGEYENNGQPEKNSVQKNVAWVKTLVNSEKFVEKYVCFRTLYSQRNVKKLQEDMEAMVDSYLYGQGLSAFSFGDDYGMFTYRLEQMQSVLRKEARRIGAEL